MSPATWPRDRPADERLLFIDPVTGQHGDHLVAHLPQLLRRGDLLVVNDSATLPAAFDVELAGKTCELRLLSHRMDGSWWVVLFGVGSWRDATEHRPPPPEVHAGDILDVAGLRVEVREVSPASPRLVRVAFRGDDDDALWAHLYEHGRPVQYSYVKQPLALWHVQTRYAGRPWSVELPSAGRPLTWDILARLAQRGVTVTHLTHAAGLSSTGDAHLDALLPLTERFDIPAATVDAVARTRANGGRVVAVGTSVVRALEGQALQHGGTLVAGAGETDLRITPGFRPAIVDGLFTGLHEPTASHHQLLQAFAPRAVLEDAYAHAVTVGYLHHEFGDSSLLLHAS